MHKTLKKKLNFKAFRSTRCQRLTKEHKIKRKTACKTFLKMGDDWSKNVIWSVEKWFTLRPHHNRKNDVTWGKVNPHEVVESKEQGVSKVMAWVGFVNGKFLPIHWFEGNVDGDQYKSMLESKVWPAVRRSASRNRLWFMQDGARPHTTNECLDFLKEKFNNRVISDRVEKNQVFLKKHKPLWFFWFKPVFLNKNQVFLFFSKIPNL